MTLHAVIVPKWGLAMEEGTLANWLAPEGAMVAQGDEIAEVETSKIANVVEAPAPGVLRHVAAAGEVKALGALLAVIADASENETVIDAFIADHASRFAHAEASALPRAEAETMMIEGQPFRFLRVAPADDAPSGRPVILMHGFGGDHRNWMFNQTALGKDRPVYAIDLPGHGGSTKQVGDGSLATLAARVVAWIESMGRGRVHLVGHSMGAAVAAIVALDNPDRVKSLTALCGAGFGGALNRDYVEGFITAQRRKDLKPFVQLLFADPDLVTREMLDDLVAYKRIDGVDTALRLLADGALGEAALTALSTRLLDLGVPLLQIDGAVDRVMPISADAAAEVIGDAGHMPHLEAANLVNARIAQFLQDND